jgi:hypothetical protein
MAYPGYANATGKSGTVSNVALTLITFGFTAAQVQAASRATLSIESGSIRVTWDSDSTVNPTTSSGMLMKIQPWPLPVIDGQIRLQALKLIRDGSVDATVYITLEGD